MMWIQLLSILSILTVVQSQRSFAIFQIRKRHTSHDKSHVVEYKNIQSSVQAYEEELVTQQDFANNHQAILQFVCVETNLPQYKERVYLTSVDEISLEKHGQKIVIILGPQTSSININAINYVHTRQRPKQIFTQIVQTKLKEDPIFMYQYAPKKTEAENQTFFAKYKWPLIIGAAVVYMMMSASPPGQQGAGGGAGR